MQYKKLGFNRLFKGCGSDQVPCSLIGNHTAIPNFAYCRTFVRNFKNNSSKLMILGIVVYRNDVNDCYRKNINY
jgi:hypothetical protein